MPTEKSNYSRYVVPSVIHPTGDCCICVPVPNSPEYIAQFMGAIWRMSLQTHYERDDAHSGAIVAAKWRAIWQGVQAAMNCCEPTFTEINQQITINNLNIKLLMQNIRQLWIAAAFDVQVAFYQTPDDFDTDPGDAGDEIDTRHRALCLAVEGWIDEAFNQGMAFIEASAVDVVPIAIGTATLPIVGPLISLTLGTTMLVFGITSYQELLKEEYRAYIACAMFSNLIGIETSDRDGWNACLDSFPEPRPTPESPLQDAVRDIIEEWLRSQLNNLDNYLAFVSNLSTAMDVAGNMGDEECGCLGWVHEFDFTEENDGWHTRVDDDRDYGNYVSGEGWVSVFDGDNDAERLYIERDFSPDTLLTRAQIFYTLEGPPGPNRASAMQIKDDTVVQDTDLFTGWVTPGEYMHDWSFRETGDEFEQSFVMTTLTDTNKWTLTRIVLRGEGIDPFLAE